LITSFELVPESDFLRDGKAQRGVADFDVATTGGKVNNAARGVVLSVGTQFLHVHRWRDRIRAKAAGSIICTHHAIDKPETPIRRLGDGRLKSAGTRGSTAPSKTSRNSDGDDPFRLLPPVFEFRIRDGDEPTFGVEPQRRVIIPNRADDRIARQAVLRCQRLHLVVLPTNQSVSRSRPTPIRQHR
jgi:hypothetical protein